MRTDIEIDDALMRKALRVGKLKTKRDTVDAALISQCRPPPIIGCSAAAALR